MLEMKIFFTFVIAHVCILRKAKLNNAHGCIFKTNELELLKIQLIEFSYFKCKKKIIISRFRLFEI